MTAIGIGVVGLGKIARDQHLPAIAGNDRFDLVATVERSGEADGINFTSHRDMIRDVAGLAAVAITTPPGPRYAIARDCIDAGLHVLLEKPPTATLAQIAELEEYAASRGVTLFATWHAQHNAAVTAAAGMLRGRPIRDMRITWHEDVEKWHPGQQWIWQAGGFGVFDPGINAFSIVSAIFPGPLSVERSELRFEEGADTPVAAIIRFASPHTDGPLDCSLDFRTDPEEWTIAITTDDGLSLRLVDGGARLFVDGKEQATAGLAEYPDIYREFADLIDEGRSRVDVVPLRLVADCLLVGGRRPAR